LFAILKIELEAVLLITWEFLTDIENAKLHGSGMADWLTRLISNLWILSRVGSNPVTFKPLFP
jgi:hypothetical protein